MLVFQIQLTLHCSERIKLVCGLCKVLFVNEIWSYVALKCLRGGIWKRFWNWLFCLFGVFFCHNVTSEDLFQAKAIVLFLCSASSGWSSVRSTEDQMWELCMNCCFSVVPWLAQAKQNKFFTGSVDRKGSLMSGAPKLQGPYFHENKCRCCLSQNAWDLHSAPCFYIACVLCCFYSMLLL